MQDDTDIVVNTLTDSHKSHSQVISHPSHIFLPVVGIPSTYREECVIIFPIFPLSREESEQPVQDTGENHPQPSSIETSITPKSPHPKHLQARMAVIETVYYQQVREQPTSVETRFNRYLQSDELPYTRRLTVDEEWRPLDSGWLEGSVGLMIISNTEGRDQKIIPTNQEKKDIERRVVELSYSLGILKGENGNEEGFTLPLFIIPPGESLRASPYSFASLRVRVQRGTARLSLTLFPL